MNKIETEGNESIKYTARQIKERAARIHRDTGRLAEALDGMPAGKERDGIEAQAQTLLNDVYWKIDENDDHIEILLNNTLATQAAREKAGRDE